MPTKPFEIGLAMAGAVSAGAYTAGVLDFLIQALDEWYAAKDKATRDADVPPHDVLLRVLSGASAGGMCSAMAAVCLGEPFVPVEKPEEAADGNKLFHAWVKKVDIVPLLEVGDIESNRPPLSALNGNILDQIGADIVTPNGAHARRYVADPLHVLMTTTNLRGVPYHLVFQDGGGGSGTRPHYMTMHADYVHFEMKAAAPRFALLAQAAEPDRGIALQRERMSSADKHWALFTEAALATGAFPIGLPPRRVDVPPSVYVNRKWRVLTQWRDSKVPGQEGTFEASGQLRGISPDWPDSRPPDSFPYIAVDGGAMDNEPVELARALLPASRDSTSVSGAESALVMVAPFPNSVNPASTEVWQRFADYQYQPKNGKLEWLQIGQVASRIIRSFVEQSRFKPGEIARADDPNIFDQFLVAPIRSDRKEGQSNIACGGLDGFSGFLGESFRRHDYQLGRRNAQRFFQCYFTLPMYDTDSGTGPPRRTTLFADWPLAAVQKHLVVRTIAGKDLNKMITGNDAWNLICLESGQPLPKDPKLHRLMLPIVPLCGTACTVIPTPTWPVLGQERNRSKLCRLVKKRLDAVLDQFIATLPGQGVLGFFEKQALYFARRLKSGSLTDKMLDVVEANLRKEGLIDANWQQPMTCTAHG